MTDQPPDRAEEIFHASADLDPAERSAYLDRACAGDHALRAEVESLLGHDATPTHGLLRIAGRASDAAGERPGDRVGRFELVEVIGEGGFGVVYLAEQTEPIRRRVALKLIKAGMDTRRVITRFNAERQTLASMDHPHIARVLDAGTTRLNRPYFVMEHAPGEPITRYCAGRGLGVEARLRLMLQVCAAVNHAHQRAIIHRDIKPANVLVTEIDGSAHAKVIDFGIAKALDREEGPTLTQEGAPVGTPRYMSPEQFSGGTIDTRTDVYAIGVLLYELLTGSTPFEESQLRSGGLAWSGPPGASPRPSARASRSGEGAAVEGLPGAALARRLRGDLDWITLRALEHEPSRRYGAVSELAADIERHLRHEPVLAGPPSPVYRARKFVRRHAAGVTAATLVALTLVAGVIGTGVGLGRALDQERLAREAAARESQARALAEDRLEKVRSVARSLIFDVREQLAEIPGTTAAQRAIVDTGLRYLDELRAESAENTALSDDLVAGYLRLAMVLGNPHGQNLGDYEGALEVLDRAVELSLRRLEGAPGDAQTLLRLSSAHGTRSSILLSLGRTREAISEAETSRDMTRRAAAAGAEGDMEADLAYAEANIGRMAESVGDHDAALTGYRAFADFARARIAAEPDDMRAMGNLAVILGRIGDLQRNRLGDPAAALGTFREQLGVAEALLEATPESAARRKSVAFALHNVTYALSDLDRHEDAKRHAERALGIAQRLASESADDRQAQRLAATSVFVLAWVHDLADEPAASLPWSERYIAALDGLLETLRDDARLQRDRALASASLGRVLGRLGRDAEGIAALRDAIDRADRLAASDPAEVMLAIDRARHRQDLADLYLGMAHSQGDPAARSRAARDARTLLTEALDIRAALVREGRSNPFSEEEIASIEAALSACAALLGETRPPGERAPAP